VRLHVFRNVNGAGVLGKGTGDGLADPPGHMGGDAEASAHIELGVPGVSGRKFTVPPSAFAFTELRQWAIKKGVRNRFCVGLENQGLFLAYVPIIYAFLFDQQNA
jgi:hypothetical protein